MSNEIKEKPKKNKITKEAVQKEVYAKMAQVFAEYRNEANSKKFDRKFEKAIKLFVPLVIKGKSEKKD
jgi:hypothetical protein